MQTLDRVLIHAQRVDGARHLNRVDHHDRHVVASTRVQGGAHQLVGSLLRLNLIRNPGAAFGMGSEVTIVFTIFAMLATVGCLVFALPRITRTWHAIALGLLLAGITGNLVDRLMQPPAALHGHVIDMFQLQGFAIFNIADVCITAAAVLIIIGSFRSERTDDVVEAPAEEQAA